MAFQQGLSGLNASSTALDVIGNNIANSSTVGFKAGNAQFSDVYAASLAGSGALQVGIGTRISAVAQQFTQGNTTTTNNPLDIAINGPGFFRMSTNNVITYTRNGQFHSDKEGYIVNDKKQRLTGYPTDVNGNVVRSSPIEIRLSTTQAPPRATNDPLSGSMYLSVNLDSRDGPPAVGPFNYQNPQTYNHSVPIPVFDTLGVPHTLTAFYVRTATPGTWNVYATLDGATPTALPNMTFNTSGVLTSAPTVTIPPVFPLTSGAVTPWSPGVLDLTGSTQYGSKYSTDKLIQGGYAPGALAGISVGDDGVILGRYSNGVSRNLGQVVLANFQDPNGLINLGGNQWAETSTSGPPLLGAPGTGTMGVVNSSSVEESNVDLTNELVDMITQQRNYQANAQTIKTQDQILQTLVNLR